MSDDVDARSDAPLVGKLMPAWKPGQSGNPGGKPAGAHNRLTTRFLYDLAADFEEHGAEAINATRQMDPAKYVQIVASLMPRELTVSTRPLEDMTEEELRSSIATIDRYLAAGAPALGIGATESGEPALVVPSVPEAAGVPRRRKK